MLRDPVAVVMVGLPIVYWSMVAFGTRVEVFGADKQ